jgi:RNA polymerase sigma-70 factor, ECF subfamily
LLTTGQALDDDKENTKLLSEIVSRIIAGDSDAEGEIVRLYQKGVATIIRKTVRSVSSAEDVAQDTLRKVLEKIRRGELREPERLSGFVCSVARNSAIEHIRRARKYGEQEAADTTEKIPDPAPNQLDEILSAEKARTVHRIIRELKLERDRELLRRYYLDDEDKDKICASLGLTRTQFNNVISRAKARFRELYVQRFGTRD